MSQGAPQPVPPPLLQRGLLQAGSPLDEQRLIAHVLRYCTGAGYALRVREARQEADDPGAGEFEVTLKSLQGAHDGLRQAEFGERLL